MEKDKKSDTIKGASKPKRSKPSTIEDHESPLSPQSKYKPEYAVKLRDHLSKGYSFESFHIGVARSTKYEWLKSVPEFKQAHDEGLEQGLALLESLLLGKATGHNPKYDPKNCDLGAIIFPLKTRFHKIYGDKTKHEVESDKGISINLNYTKDAD